MTEVIYLKDENKILKELKKNNYDIMPDVVNVKNSIDGNMFLIKYDNGITIEIDRSNVVFIRRDN